MSEKPDLPATVHHRTLDRSALERVLARASELQSQEGDTGEALSEQQLIDIGREVGLSPLHIQRALAEERTRFVPEDTSNAVTRYFGAARIGAKRVVRGHPAAVLNALDRWMDREELLQLKRTFPDARSWEARRDFLGSIKRGFNVGGRGYALSSAFEVNASVSPLDGNNVLVQLTADYSVARGRSIWGGVASVGIMGTLGSGVVALALATGGSVLIAGGGAAIITGLGVASAYGVARASRKLIERGQLALEQALDRLEAPVAAQSSVLGGLLDAAVRELK